MKWKTTLLLVVAFAALLVFYLFHERGAKTTEEAARDAKRVFHFEEKEVRSVRIVRPEDSVRLERTEADRWTMIEPVKGRADRWSAGAAAGALAELEQQRSVRNERGTAGLEEMGLAKPRARVEFTLAAPAASTNVPHPAPAPTTGGAGGADAVVVEFGSDVPATSSVFVRLPGHDEILLVPSSSAAPFLKPLDDYRDRALLDLTILDVGEAIVSRPAGELRFKRRDEDWWIEQPLEDLAAGDAVQSLLSALIGLRAETFIDVALASGLELPQSAVRLFDRKGAEIATVKIGAPVPGQSSRLYTRVDTPAGRGPVVTVTTGGLEALSKAAADFRSHKALSFRSWEASRINITSTTVTLSFQKKDGVWTASAPSSLEVDAAAVEKTLQDLADLAITSFDLPAGATASSLGLEPPRTRIEISTDPGGTKITSLVLGAPAATPHTLYARALKRPALFAVDASILERVSGGPSLYELKAKAAPKPSSQPSEPEEEEQTDDR